jgi:antibiotic biosynthesis monooxygenase (ABM) superfamily enzyme
VLTTITSLIARGGHEAAVTRDFETAFVNGGRDTHHLGTMLIHQDGGLSFLVSQFADEAELHKWRSSSAHREMISSFERHSVRELCTFAEPVARISVPSDSSGPRWKVLVSTWVFIYPLLLLLSFLLELVSPGLPMAARLAITSLALSVTSIWVINPVTRSMTRVWRLRDQQMGVDIFSYSGDAGSRQTRS